VEKAVVAKPKRTSIMEHWNRLESILCPMAHRERTQLNLLILKAKLEEQLAMHPQPKRQFEFQFPSDPVSFSTPSNFK
jgi:hypothetical protein